MCFGGQDDPGANDFALLALPLPLRWLTSWTAMPSTNAYCSACSSSNLAEFIAEIGLHIRGLARLNRGHIFVFPTVALCLDCGLLQAILSADDLQRIRDSGERPANAI